MICLLLNALKLNFPVIYKLQVSIIDAAKHTGTNKIRLGCRANSTTEEREDVFRASIMEGCGTWLGTKEVF